MVEIVSKDSMDSMDCNDSNDSNDLNDYIHSNRLVHHLNVLTFKCMDI